MVEIGSNETLVGAKNKIWNQIKVKNIKQPKIINFFQVRTNVKNKTKNIDIKVIRLLN